MKLSVVVIAKNEEAVLEACLKSVAFADEIVLVDDESTDRTPEIAKAHKAHIYARKLDGFATQKNFGIDKTVNDWVLILDADERVTPELATEIQQLKPDGGAVAYSIPFRNYIGNTWLKHGVLGRDKHIRLFDRRHAHYGHREVHEQLEIDGDTGNLTGTISHLTYANTQEYLAKVRKYSRLEAQESLRTKQIQPYHGLFREFLFRYFKLGGLLDGWLGLVSASYETYYRWLYQQYVTGKRT
jgi:glycosyltransferase involved in cell wall biosynthesis